MKVVKEVIGIRPEYKNFGTMHIINSPKGTYYIADTLVNENPDKDTLVDIAKLASTAVRFFNEKPVIAMVSHSNFGSNTSDGAKKVKYAVEEMQQLYPDLPIDGEMQLGFALDNELRDEEYPFTKVCGKKVNTLVFPNLTSARSSYKMLQMLGTDAEAVATIDAYVDKIKKKLNAMGK